MEKFKKIIIWAAIAVILICIVSAVWRVGRFYYGAWKLGYDYQTWELGVYRSLKNDTFGGATPQETYAMFVETLRDGDVESASKFFYWEDQEEEKQRFEQMRDSGELEQYINDLPNWEEMEEEEHWDSNRKRYIIIGIKETTTTVRVPNGEGVVEAVSPPGEYVVFSINFQFNKYAGIWKIDNL